ncbi:MFS transporter [Erythrobacter sp. NE805]|uniref:MFS transporter n=1 Tax=Erythrobacter sp. NE805 TaxID=3389875 RepID=UPI00396B3C00
MNHVPAAPAPRLSAISRLRAWASVAILLVAAIISFIDRQLLSLLIDPIKHDLKVSDFQMGLLVGPAFALFHALAGIPCGWLADRAGRGKVVAGGIALWSALTAASGFAASYPQLFLARMGVGVGEATLGPSAHSLIADSFDAKRLPLAMAVYSTGVALGAGLAFAFGAQAVSLVGHLPDSLPLVGTLRDWQLAFVLVGLPGLPVALLVLLVVREPRAAGGQAQGAAIFAGLAPLWRGNRRLILCYLAAISALTGSGYASHTWLPAHFIRNFGWTPQQAGLMLGAMLMAAGVAGALAAGAAGALLARRGVLDAPLRVIIAASLLHAPFTAAVTLVGAEPFAVLLMAPATFLSSAFVALGPAAVQAATPVALRGRVAAIVLMVTSLAGMVAGPVGVGALTSFVFGDDKAVGLGLAIVAGLLSLIGGVLLLAALAPYRAAILRLRTAPD